MSLPYVVSGAVAPARRRLLVREKEFTVSDDALDADRRRPPMVKVDKEYVFEGRHGPVTLARLLGGQAQLIVQHVMFAGLDKPCRAARAIMSSPRRCSRYVASGI